MFGTDNTGNSTYQVLLNDGRGNFSVGGSESLPAASIGSSGLILSGDFNHDGKLDFASLNASPIAIFFGNGDGTFAAAVPMGATTGGAPVLVDTADFNCDGYTDIVYTATFYNDPSQIRLLLSAPDGSYSDSLINGLPSDSPADGRQSCHRSIRPRKRLEVSDWVFVQRGLRSPRWRPWRGGSRRY